MHLSTSSSPYTEISDFDLADPTVHLLHFFALVNSNFKRFSIFILIVRNRDFNGKIAPKSFSKWLFKYSENSSLEYKQDIEKLLESEDV